MEDGYDDWKLYATLTDWTLKKSAIWSKEGLRYVPSPG